VSTSVRQLVSCVCEVGWLCKRLRDALDASTAQQGIVAQVHGEPYRRSFLPGDPRHLRSLAPSSCPLPPALFPLVALCLDRRLPAAQGFYSAIRSEMTDYYRLLAALENQIGAGRELTLHRLLAWSKGPLEKLEILNILVVCYFTSNIISGPILLRHLWALDSRAAAPDGDDGDDGEGDDFDDLLSSSGQHSRD